MHPVDQYIQKYPTPIQRRLQVIRKTILSVVPEGVEVISYGIPTVTLNSTPVVHYAAFKKHIGFFPTPSPIPIFAEELRNYKTSKGTIQFPNNEPIPYGLIQRITRFRRKEIIQKTR